MNDFEQELTQALARKPAPDGFAARVLARAQTVPARWPPRWAGIALAASLLIGTIAWAQWDRRDRERRAHAQLLLALKITSGQLHKIHNRLEGAN